MYGPVASLEKVALPVCRTPRPADFQGPGVVPMTPKVNIEHQILGKQAKEAPAPPEKAVAVKQEDGWGLVAPDPDLTTDVVVEVSSSSESESSVSEMSLLSDDGAPTPQEPPPKLASWQAKPSSDEKWFQHSSSKVIHAAPVHDEEATLSSLCGRIMKAPFRELTEATEWTFKCGVCFAGRRQPTVT